MRVFRMYDEGWSKRGIAHAFNEEGVKTRDAGQKKNGRVNPGTWSAAGIKSILENEIYVGVFVWNQSSRRGRKLPISGRKRLKRNPKEEHITRNGFCPGILPPELWERVQVRLAEDARAYAQSRTARVRERYLLSGLLNCTSCGRSFSIGSKGRGGHKHYRCGYRASRPGLLCENKVTVSQPGLEQRVKSIVDTLVKDPQSLRGLVGQHNSRIATVNAAQLAEVVALESKLAGLVEERERLVEAVAYSEQAIVVLVNRLEATEADIDVLQERIEKAQERLQPQLEPSLCGLEDLQTGAAS
ncbi:MAG: hypothetical protein GY811_10595, partial [Myxococcales bacterium]|nr:hypothetical protein [Myxococcales bacterium]